VTTALTKYGILGIKVWISRGDIIAKVPAKTTQADEKKIAMQKVLAK
jgi:ribosomal protein S3